jgi:hypothetical protein
MIFIKKGFKANPNTLAKFEKTLLNEMATTAPEIRQQGRTLLAQWRREGTTTGDDFAKDIAKQVAPILFDCAAWDGWLNESGVEDYTVEFTQELFKRFDEQ